MRAALGLHTGHDRAASLVIDGELTAHVAQERLDRRKHSESPALPFEAIDAVMAYARIDFSALSCIGISYVNCEVDRFHGYYLDALRSRYGHIHADVFMVPHHLAHAYAAFFTSPYREAMVLVTDGAGDLVDGDFYESESAYLAGPGGIELVERRLQAASPDFQKYPFFFNAPLIADVDRDKQVSLGKKYEQFSYLVGFSHFEDGKTMGLASYGKPMLDVQARRPNDFKFSLTMADLLTEVEVIRRESGASHHTFTTQRRADLASTVQCFIEEAMTGLLTHLRQTIGDLPLCAAGGVILNCVANDVALRRAKVSAAHLLPPAGDDGQSIGTAFYADYRVHPKWSRKTNRFTPYLGPAYEPRKIRQTLEAFGLSYTVFDDADLVARLAEIIVSGRIVGFFRGRSEMGPRALCHRSILADPTRNDMKDHLNLRVKYREEFRPYAPVVPSEAQHQYFDLVMDSPHMLLAGSVRAEFRDRLPAITHVDGTARVQAISRQDEPFVHHLLYEVGKHSGIPILLNTSFNIAGDPMVETPHDAVTCFLRTNIDALAIDNFLIEKS
jgi:carbamoyltransferase